MTKICPGKHSLLLLRHLYKSDVLSQKRTFGRHSRYWTPGYRGRLQLSNHLSDHFSRWGRLLLLSSLPERRLNDSPYGATDPFRNLRGPTTTTVNRL
ncbi:hypothetical protein CEXT_7221 [Caerostris extrusa]|uniref:Uncharacterized protein n=1 Tax=Caerostris extrusa TaxID=172846 RepID=A0AAV4MY78_CAEEX|nr:hypothetical protein CEXT_7221 [Caerostris extrusa]